MNWLEEKIRRYEHARWTTDDNRRVFPFEWGLEHIRGRADEPDPRGFLTEWVPQTIARSDDWFATSPASDYRLASTRVGLINEGVLTFSSEVESSWKEN